MSYYRSFANLVSLLGLITMGLIAAAVYVGFYGPRPSQNTETLPRIETEPVTQPTPPASPDGFDRRELERLKTPVPVAPPRDVDNSLTNDDLPLSDQELQTEKLPGVYNNGGMDSEPTSAVQEQADPGGDPGSPIR